MIASQVNATEATAKPFRIEGKLRALSREEASVKDRCCKMAGDLIALGKFLRDHSIENPLEHDLRKAAKAATEKKFYELHRYLLAAVAAGAASKKNTGTADATPVQVIESDAKNIPLDKLMFIES